jgi:MYXO-CTERM domain-containing protein
MSRLRRRKIEKRPFAALSLRRCPMGLDRGRFHRRLVQWCVVVGSAMLAHVAGAETVTVDAGTRYQTLDGFGTMTGSNESEQSWWQQLFFDDLRASLFRVDIEPTFVAPYSNLSYCSPWFGQPAPLTLDNNQNGPDGSRTRRYTGPADYSNAFGGCSAPIAVMGPDIDKNVAFFDYKTAQAASGVIAQLGTSRASQLGDFKLYGSMFSPAPWVKVSSGNTYGGSVWPLPAAVPWPFIWGGNFSGGLLDVSGTPLSVFDDGTGPTSSLTQFARGLAAFLRGYQNAFQTKFYAISLQNELNFEEFYSSATYPKASQYIAALKAARVELDKYPDLAPIRIVGPEDLMGNDAYSMWQFGSGAGAVTKNLNYLAAVAADATAVKALAGFAIHAYLANGSTSAGADPQSWGWWANGWQTSPAGGLPADVKGFTSYGKPSWMTETSGEKPEWLASSMGGGFPDSGAFSIALKIHQALTTGTEQAWIYLRLTDGSPADDTHLFTLTDAKQAANCPKYVAAKHFFRYVRPGAQRVNVVVDPKSSLFASAFVLDASAAVTIVLINTAATPTSVTAKLESTPSGLTSMSAFTSSSGSLWQSSTASVSGGQVSVTVPGYGITTLYGTGTLSTDGGGPGNPDASTPDGSGMPAADGSTEDGPGGGAANGGSGGCGCRTSPTEDAGAPVAFAVLLFFARRWSSRSRKPSVS